ncbi:MAG: nucleotide pyrophosphohydrolase [Firmicutes bacterium]|jgi:NTP pyrophosphatase (non-canonical NTP hydrolase)|nr:nucleotide pyrophosphohydrolase [Bacillota bacterium]
MEIREAQRRVDGWIQQFEEGYWGPLTNLARLMEEVGELAREVNHRFGQKRKKPDEPDKEIADELGDIFWALICLANSLQIDLDAALERTLRKVTERDHDRFKRKES